MGLKLSDDSVVTLRRTEVTTQLPLFLTYLSVPSSVERPRIYEHIIV